MMKYKGGPHKTENDILRFGFYVSLTTAAVTVITFAIALLTPPLSGPFCRGDCLEYPYADILARFPRDYYWMYPTMLISVLFVLLMVTIQQYADSGKKLYGQIGLSIALIASAILIPNYFVQVSVIPPSLVNGETDGIALISQFNPHGIFIALEEIGFLLMSFSLFMIIPVFDAGSGIKRAMRITWSAGFILILIAFILISVKYGIMREYIFEVAVISIVWLELIVSSVLLSIHFRRAWKKNIRMMQKQTYQNHIP